MKGAINMKSILKEFQKNKVLYLLLIVPFIVLILFYYVPMYGIQIAFKDYNLAKGIFESPWVGMKHFARFFTNPQFWTILRNTLVLSLYGLATFPLSIILALLLNYIPSKRFGKAVQMISYIPYFLSTVVICGMILQFFDARSGVFNAFMGLFGISAQNYMSNPAAYPHIFVWTGVWQGIGYGSVIYIATLSGVSPELHEAAIVDGASIMQRIRYVDLPSIMPTIAILLIMNCGGILNSNFEKGYLLQNSLNTATSEVIGTYVYKQSFKSALPQYSYSTAIGLFNSVVNMILLFIVNKLSDKFNGNSLF